MPEINNRKIIKAVLLTAASLILLTGCSLLLEDDEPEDSVEIFTAGNASDQLPDGLYIKSGDLFMKTYDGCRTYRGKYDEQNYYMHKAERLIWYTSQLERVPVLDAGASVIYRSSTKIPDSFTLEAFGHMCDSVGIRNISMNDAGMFVLSRSGSDIHPDSSAYAALSGYIGNGTVILDSVNGIKMDGSMVNRAGVITGLEGGKTYRLGFYIGTKYYEADIVADTSVYSSKEGFKITTYRTTRDGYIILDLPELMDPGLYDLDGAGTFLYEGVESAMQEYVPPAETETAATEAEETLPAGGYGSYEETKAEEPSEEETGSMEEPGTDIPEGQETESEESPESE